MNTTDLTLHIMSKLDEEENGYNVPYCHPVEKNTFLCIFSKSKRSVVDILGNLHIGPEDKVLTISVADITDAFKQH